MTAKGRPQLLCEYSQHYLNVRSYPTSLKTRDLSPAFQAVSYLHANPKFAKSYLDLGGLLQLFPISLPNWFTYHGWAEWYELNHRCNANGQSLRLSPRITSTIDYLFAYASGIREVHRPETQHHSQDTERHQKIRDIHMCRQYNANGRHAWLLEYHDSLVQIRRVIGCLGIRSPSSYKTTKSLIQNVLTRP